VRQPSSCLRSAASDSRVGLCVSLCQRVRGARDHHLISEDFGSGRQPERGADGSPEARSVLRRDCGQTSGGEVVQSELIGRRASSPGTHRLIGTASSNAKRYRLIQSLLEPAHASGLPNILPKPVALPLPGLAPCDSSRPPPNRDSADTVAPRSPPFPPFLRTYYSCRMARPL